MNTCRSCGSPTERVLTLGEMPLANHLLEYPSESYKKYPLELVFCPSCKLGQLRDQVDPALMFDEYVYYSSVNGPTIRLAWDLAAHINNERKLQLDSLVVEIGSNDGYLLKFYEIVGMDVLGIDPARGPANVAAMKGIPTVQDYFTLKLARTLPKADVIHAHNVLAHVRDLNDFVSGIAEMLKPDGVCVVEVPYLGCLVEKAAFDTVYAEHNFYFSMTAAFELFWRNGLVVDKTERITAHGGSLRMFFRKRNQIDAGILMNGTERFDFDGMREKIVQQTRALFDFVRGKKAWGFGAAAKATVMLNYCGVSSELLYCIADSTPAKIGKFIPGTGQRIVSPGDWLAEQPEYTCIFAWNYEEEIRKKYQGQYKGTFFTPYKLPQ